jgi:hypothetical protein
MTASEPRSLSVLSREDTKLALTRISLHESGRYPEFNVRGPLDETYTTAWTMFPEALQELLDPPP